MSRLSREYVTLSTIFSGEMSNTEHLKAAAAHIALGRMVVIDNDAVWALWGDAAQDSFVQTVQQIKGRSSHNRFGLTMPINRLVHLTDFGRIHPALRPLFEQPDRLTQLLGGLAFIRFPVAPTDEQAAALGPHVLSSDLNGAPLLQNYDPTGKRNIELLVQESMDKGAMLPAASSMNISGHAEIMTTDEARKFMEVHRLKDGLIDTTALRLSRGSFLILEATQDGWCMHREGNVSTDIIRRLLDRQPFIISDRCKPAAGHPYVGHDEDVKGAELRTALLASFGWDAVPHQN